MHKKIIVTTGLSCLIALATGWAEPGDRDRDRDRMHQQDMMQQQDKMQQRDMMQDRDQLRDRDQVFGWQLMTEQERNEFRAKMRSLKTAEEREALRREHHKEMQVRAKERGVTLPEMP